ISLNFFISSLRKRSSETTAKIENSSHWSHGSSEGTNSASIPTTSAEAPKNMKKKVPTESISQAISINPSTSQIHQVICRFLSLGSVAYHNEFPAQISTGAGG